MNKVEYLDHIKLAAFNDELEKVAITAGKYAKAFLNRLVKHYRNPNFAKDFPAINPEKLIKGTQGALSDSPGLFMKAKNSPEVQRMRDFSKNIKTYEDAKRAIKSQWEPFVKM